MQTPESDFGEGRRESLPVAIVGGGPAGLFAAERISAAGFPVHLFEAKPSVGRKFLVAGRGGLNLTHSEPLDVFKQRYTGGGVGFWDGLLDEFCPDDLRQWAEHMGVRTYVGSSGRVFPVEMNSAALLRKWVSDLKQGAVQFHSRHRLNLLKQEANGWTLVFETAAGSKYVKSRSVLLALGGASWPRTGSDGEWIGWLSELGIRISPLKPANCGWNVCWNPVVLAEGEGLPVKNIRVSVDGEQVAGELVITREGIEGGPLYHLGPKLRSMAEPQIFIDLKADLTAEAIRNRVGEEQTKWIHREHLCRVLRLGPAASALLHQTDFTALGVPWEWIKRYPIRLEGPMPIDGAISTAGGVCFEHLTRELMVEKSPGLFFAGEMLDWEAPTGGYLLQGCFATAARAAEGVIAWLGGEAVTG